MALETDGSSAVPLKIDGGNADSSVDPTGSGNYTTDGLGEGAKTLDQVCTIENLDLNGNEFVTFKMFYDEQELEAKGILEEDLRMWWWDTTQGKWVMGGTNTSGEKGQSAFAGVETAGEDWGLGYTGLNLTENYTWVNANHASDYIQATPEPGSAVLMIIGLLGLTFAGGRRRRND